MALERDFLKLRYQIICKRMAQANEYDLDAQGNFYMTCQPDPNLDYNLVLEQWLIEKLLREVKEGSIQRALTSWHKQLSTKWHEHSIYYRKIAMAYDQWTRLPWALRMETPEPPHPPDLEIKDTNGDNWVVDPRLLDVLKDINTRLEKWLEDDS
jgi:hypothetical protein